MSLEIRPLDTRDRDQIDAMRLLNLRSLRVRRPEQEPRSLDELTTNVASQPPGWQQAHFLGYVGSELVGTCAYWHSVESDPDKAIVQVDVDPVARRRGFGTELAHVVEERLPAVVELMLAETDFADEEWDSTPEGRFALALGYEATEFFTMRALPWPPAPAPLAPVAPGYEVRTYVDGLPEPLRASYGVLAALVDVDSPSGEIEWSGEPETPEHYQQHLDRVRAGGNRLVETVATHGGEVVALTSVLVPGNPKRPLHVQNTYVHRDHRGHRLGMAVKTAIQQGLVDLELPHPRLETGNADANPWMVAINEQLGFRPVLRSAELIKRRPARDTSR